MADFPLHTVVLSTISGHRVTSQTGTFCYPHGSGVTIMAKDLTSLAIANLLKKPPVSRREVPDGKARGLFLVLQPTGKASWAVRYRVDGRPCKLTLGPFPGLDLRAAREAAGGALAEIAQGGDPARARRQAKAAGRSLSAS